MLALSAVATPVMAVNVESEDVPSEAEVGSEYSATVMLEDLFTENQQWQLNATTELENQPLWTLELVDDGEVMNTITRTGQNVTFSDSTIQSPVDHVRVTVEGEVPAVGNYSYADQSTFSAMSLAQVPVTSDGSTGAPSTIDSWTAAHYTSESSEARDAIDAASDAIASAEAAGADVSDAKGGLENAKRFYRNADFEAAVTNAEDAQELAEESQGQQESAEQTQQLLIFAGIGLVVLLLIGGGVLWYKQNKQDTCRLG
jgi:sensor c-di-GMP phosphodiesterase-like protein